MGLTTEKKIVFGIIGITLAILVGGALLLSKQPEQKIPEVSQADTKYLKNDNSHQSAKDSAKIDVVEFADLQCPSCGAVYPVVKQLKNDYKDQVNFVFRHFPLEQHKNGFNASLAAEAASSQGKFWEMEDLLFTNQASWSDLGNPEEIFAGYAKDLSLDVDKFKKDYEARSGEDIIKADKQDGISLGVDATPTFFINGKKIAQVLSLDQFKTLINQELSGK